MTNTQQQLDPLEVFNNQPPKVTSELFKALAKAQGKIQGAIKDSNNPYFNSKYADLGAVYEAIREQFEANGLSTFQRVFSVDSKFCIETILAHSSGESISSGVAEILVPNKTPQGVGSSVTYMRRYQLAALAGVAQVDDDGNAATPQNPKTGSVPQQQPRQATSKAQTQPKQNTAQAGALRPQTPPQQQAPPPRSDGQTIARVVDEYAKQYPGNFPNPQPPQPPQPPAQPPSTPVTNYAPQTAAEAKIMNEMRGKR